MNNITSGIANTSVQKMKNRNKLPKQDVILNLIQVILQQIYLMKGMEPSSVYFMLEDVVQMELSVIGIIEFLVYKIVSL